MSDGWRHVQDDLHRSRDAAHLAGEQITQMRALADTYWRDGEALRAAQARDRADLDAARAERDGLRAELDQVYASRSWLITRPMRGVRRLLGRGE